MTRFTIYAEQGVVVESINRSGWLSITEAADYLKLSQSFIRKQVRHQGIPFARPGGKVLRFRRSDLDHWLESSNSGPASEIDTKEQLNELDYAQKLLRELGWPVLKGNLLLIAEVLAAEAKKHEGSKAGAFDYLRDRVLADQADGLPITGSYLRQLTAEHPESR
jgi:excisionase family DNA binding protein